MVREGRLEIGVLIAFISYVLWLFWPVIHIVNQWNVLVAGMASAERVFEVLRWPVEPREPSRVQSEKLRGEIRFENVWFAYRNEDWVLKDLSFSIAAGERIGVVGATGSGKSTLLALLFRFYEPQKGTIYLDGVPLSAWPLEELRRQIALIQQDGALFEGTAGQNISLFASPELSDEPGLSADVSDRAVAELSAGERQWVAFLRAARRHPTVWFLDEAAAHLDPALDAELHQMVTARAERSTVIIVAHRLSSVRELDRIIVLHHGRIVESGPHGELVGQNGLYARMVALQEAVLEERP
jgi:ABC-type multidrug transport system fused ATPase/permease subunit